MSNIQDIVSAMAANDRFAKPTAVAGLSNDKKKTASISLGQALRMALSSSQPGNWATDHAKESEQFTGWNYVGLRPILLQALQADVTVYDDSGPRSEQRKSHRKLMRSLTGLQKQFLDRTKSYQLNNDESEPLPPDDPLVKLMKEPNPSQSGGLFNYERLQQLGLTGTALIWNVPNQKGKPIQRYVVPTAIAQPNRPTTEFPNGYYRIMPATNRWLDNAAFMSGGLSMLVNGLIPAEQIQIIRWPHPVYRDDGYSGITATARWTDTANMVDQARWQQMRCGPNPSIGVSIPDDVEMSIDEIMDLQKQIEERYGGASKNRSVIVGRGEISKLSSSAEEMDFENAFTQMRDASLAVHGTPPMAAGIVSPTGREGLYAPLTQFVLLTCQPMFDMIAEEDTRYLRQWFGDGMTIEISAKTIDDPGLLEQQLATDIAAGNARTVDEYRALRGLSLLGGEKGNAFIGIKAAAAQPGQFVNYEQHRQLQQLKPLVGTGTAEDTHTPTVQPAEQTPTANESNVNKEIALNGAQITAARDVLLDVQLGNLSKDAAVELLAAVGIDRGVAARIIAAQLKLPKPEGEAAGSQPVTNGASNGFHVAPKTLKAAPRFSINGNGKHSSRAEYP